MVDRYTAYNVGKLPFDANGELVFYTAYQQLQTENERLLRVVITAESLAAKQEKGTE